MSQKTEKEEAVEIKVPPAPETLTTALCTENCKIPAVSAACNASTGAGSASPDPARLDPVHGPPPPAPEPVESVPKKKAVNRCLCCAKRVGLTGFRCRCGELFCSVHRYSDRHDCSFDYKAAGREVIARENPVVRAAKILKV